MGDKQSSEIDCLRIDNETFEIKYEKRGGGGRFHPPDQTDRTRDKKRRKEVPES